MEMCENVNKEMYTKWKIETRNGGDDERSRKEKLRSIDEILFLYESGFES